MRNEQYVCDGCEEDTFDPKNWIETFKLDSKGNYLDYEAKHFCINCQDRMLLKW